jgi:hypothetical protein
MELQEKFFIDSMILEAKSFKEEIKAGKEWKYMIIPRGEVQLNRDF